MSTANRNPGGYSADVRIRLSVNGHNFTIGQLGPDFIILKEPIDHPPAEAHLFLSIDGRARQWTIQLPDGINAEQPETRIIYTPSATNGAT
jgi:hypothetical protein